MTQKEIDRFNYLTAKLINNVDLTPQEIAERNELSYKNDQQLVRKLDTGVLRNRIRKLGEKKKLSPKERLNLEILKDVEASRKENKLIGKIIIPKYVAGQKTRINELQTKESKAKKSKGFKLTIHEKAELSLLLHKQELRNKSNQRKKQNRRNNYEELTAEQKQLRVNELQIKEAQGFEFTIPEEEELSLLTTGKKPRIKMPISKQEIRIQLLQEKKKARTITAEENEESKRLLRNKRKRENDKFIREVKELVTGKKTNPRLRIELSIPEQEAAIEKLKIIRKSRTLTNTEKLILKRLMDNRNKRIVSQIKKRIDSLTAEQKQLRINELQTKELSGFLEEKELEMLTAPKTGKRKLMSILEQEARIEELEKKREEQKGLNKDKLKELQRLKNNKRKRKAHKERNLKAIVLSQSDLVIITNSDLVNGTDEIQREVFVDSTKEVSESMPDKQNHSIEEVNDSSLVDPLSVLEGLEALSDVMGCFNERQEERQEEIKAIQEYMGQANYQP